MSYPSATDDDESPQLGLLTSSLLDNTDLRIGINLFTYNLPSIDLGGVLKILGTVLNPILTPMLDTLVDPLLKLVGVQLGTAQINLRYVDCGPGPELVY